MSDPTLAQLKQAWAACVEEEWKQFVKAQRINMTVRQLIKLLADLPGDADVYLLDGNGNQVPVCEVRMAKFVAKIPTNALDVALITWLDAALIT